MIKKNIKNILEQTKICHFTKPFYSGMGHILLFHRVCPKDINSEFLRRVDMQVSPEYIEGVIKFFIGHDYEFISLGGLLQKLHEGRASKKFVMATFDDGYADNFIYAYPVFKKYNVPFTIYLTPNFIDGEAVLWWCLLHKLVSENADMKFKIGKKTFNFKCLTKAEKTRSIMCISSIILNCNETNYPDTIEQIFAPYHMDLYCETKKLALSWEQVRQLSLDPIVTIGAHSLNHYRLTNLSESAAKHEIIESKKKIEFNIGGKVCHFSYPLGSRNEAGKREVAIVKDCGFGTGVTTRSANIFLAHRYHPHCLPRITMGEDMDKQRLNFLISGLTHCVRNKFKRVITV